MRLYTYFPPYPELVTHLDGVSHCLEGLGICFGVAGDNLGGDVAGHALLVEVKSVGDDMYVAAHG